MLMVDAAVQTVFRRAQLKALIDVHAHTAGLGGNLSSDEISVIRGALDMTHKTAQACMTPLEKASKVHRCAGIYLACQPAAV